MNHCAFCNAPILSTTEVCPNCHKKQPPYPPVLPGGGGASYSGWAKILIGLGTMLLAIGVAAGIQGPVSVASAVIYGSPSYYISSGQAQYLGQSSSVPYLGLTNTPIYPGYGYFIFFGGIALVCYIYAFISYNRGKRIDKANEGLLRQLRRNGNGNGNGNGG